jgi:hypothetical protein
VGGPITISFPNTTSVSGGGIFTASGQNASNVSGINATLIRSDGTVQTYPANMNIGPDATHWAFNMSAPTGMDLYLTVQGTMGVGAGVPVSTTIGPFQCTTNGTSTLNGRVS